MQKISLTKANRIRLARAFRNSKRVDLSIDCVIEGQMGRAYAHDPANPAAFRIEVGPFSYFAGNPRSPGGREMIKSLPPYTLLMPSPREWVEVAKEIHGDKLAESTRYSFSSANLSVEHLRSLLSGSPFKTEIRCMDAAVAARIFSDPGGIADISHFDSAEDFVERGVGYYLMARNTMAGVAYSSLVCSRGIEVSIVVLPEHRRKGIATALACVLLQYCLENGMDPNWDAADPESCILAEKLGYIPTESYTEYYIRE